MPFTMPDYTSEENPWLRGMTRGQQLGQNAIQFPYDIQAKMLANQIAQAQAKYAEPMAKEGLTAAQQQNIWNPKIWQSNIGLQGAQAGKLGEETKWYGREAGSRIGLQGQQAQLAGSEAAKNKFLVEHPQYISPEGMLIQQAIEEQQRQQRPQQMQPQSQAFGQQQAAPNAGQSGMMPNQPQPQNNAAHFSPGQYNQNALAFNPPQLPTPTGNPNLDSLYFKKFGMSPVIQAQLDLSQKQADKYQTENIKRNEKFNNEAIFSNQSTIDAHKFLDALARSSSLERGYIGSKTPAMTNAAQEMESSGANMAASATKLFQEGNAVHSADIELQQMAKPSRKQNAEVSYDLAQGVIAKNDRNKERQQFYALGTQLNLKPEILDAMWNKYETDRPYISSDTKMPNDSYKDTWKDYLHPETINSFMNGKTLIPANQKSLKEANWTKNDIDNFSKWIKQNVKNGTLKRDDFPDKNIKANIYNMANKEGITLAQLKAELKGMGAL